MKEKETDKYKIVERYLSCTNNKNSIKMVIDKKKILKFLGNVAKDV